MRIHFVITFLAFTVCGTGIFEASDAYAEEGQFSLSGGLDSNPGKLDNISSGELLNVPLAVGKFESGPWVFKLTAPDATLSGAAGTAPVIGRIKTVSSTQFGLGDTVAAATYNIYPGSSSTFGIGLTGKVKLGLADTIQGFGTGLNDYAAQADAYQSFNRFTALGSMGYKLLGNPAGIGMDSVLYGSFGGVYQLNDQMSGGVDISLEQSPSYIPAEQRFTAYLSHNINRSFKARGYVLRGYTKGSPDTGLGAQVYYGF
jgi:hypothetical protein